MEKYFSFISMAITEEDRRLFVLGLIILLIVSYVQIFLPISVGINSKGIEKAYFKAIHVGKFAFLFGNSKRYPIKKSGIITPFFIMQILAYITVILMWIAYVICAIIFEKNEPIFFAACGCVISLIDLFIIGVSARRISTKRKLERDKTQRQN